MRKLNFLIIIIIICSGMFLITKSFFENQALKKIIERLTADSRVAQAVVTDVRTDQNTGKTYTTIKFLEYDAKLNPLKPRFFTFSVNNIQFQSMVIRFDDYYVKKAHPLKGKSAYLFMKAFALTDNNGAEVFEINKVNEIPSGYRVEGSKNGFENKIWKKFWQYALDSKKAKKEGIKNVQIEAPGTKFVQGFLYTIKIEHNGGLLIDAERYPEILKPEA